MCNSRIKIKNKKRYLLPAYMGMSNQDIYYSSHLVFFMKKNNMKPLLSLACLEAAVAFCGCMFLTVSRVCGDAHATLARTVPVFKDCDGSGTIAAVIWFHSVLFIGSH